MARVNREHAWKASVDFGRPYIEEVACSDEVDRAILQLLFEAGSSGLLPKDMAAKLDSFGVARHQVSRRLVRMNLRLQEKHRSKCVAEQRGWHWALSSFAVKAWGETEQSNVEGEEADAWR